MIAPKYKELAKEYEGRVRFLKVDVQQHNVGVQVRSMPTFHFYFQGKLDHQFSGADENGMRQQTQQLDRKAEAADVEVSLGALEAFYKEHDPSKLDNVDEIYEKYPAYKLVAILKKKYGKAPEFTKKNSRKQAPKAEGGGKGEAGGDKPVDIRKMDMDDLKAEVYRREMASQEKEEELVLKKNERRREKLGLTSGSADGTSSAAPVRVAILGGGPAGMTAAIYAARAGLKPVVIAPATGGQLMGKGVGVENYPGIMEANGGDIIKLMKNQAAKFSATFEHELVASVDLSKRPFVIKTNTSALTAHALIVSTGADSRWLGAPGEDMYRGGGVSSCATCDGFLWREKHCAVIGGGDTAMEDALVLARTSSHVTLIHRRDSFRASHDRRPDQHHRARRRRRLRRHRPHPQHGPLHRAARHDRHGLPADARRQHALLGRRRLRERRRGRLGLQAGGHLGGLGLAGGARRRAVAERADDLGGGRGRGRGEVPPGGLRGVDHEEDPR